MADTYYLRHETTEAVATYEAFAALGTINQPYMQQIAVLGIFNQPCSDCVTTIKNIQINEVQARTTTTPNNLSFIRTTAQSGGIPITPVPMDTNATALPSEILIMQYPGEITTTGAPFRKMLGKLGLQPFSPLTAMASPRIGMINSGLGNNNIYENYFTADTQSITLREGEGVSLITGSVAPANFTYEVVARISDGTNTHYVNTVVNNCSMPALFGIFNGSGSGVVLTIERLEFSEIRENSILPLFSIEPISGLYGGTTVTPIALDTSNPAIPAGISIASNFTALSASPDSNNSTRSHESGDIPFRRCAQFPFGVSEGLASGMLTLLQRKQVVFDFSPVVDSTGGFILREGEGIALFNRPFSSGYINYEIIVQFTNTYTPPPSGGGEHSYVFVG